MIRDTDNELQIESWSYVGEIVKVDDKGYPVVGEDGEYEREAVEEKSEATFNEETLKLETPVEDTEFGARFTNPYTPEPIPYTPMVTKYLTNGYGPTVADKIFNFTMTEVGQVDAAGDEMEDGYETAKHEIDGTEFEWNETQITVPAGQITANEVFGEITFLKAGTFTFEIVETAENEEGITYDAGTWTLTIVIRDTDNELQIESWSYVGEIIKIDDEGHPVVGEDGEYVRIPVEEKSEAVFNEETLKLETPVEDVLFGARFTNPYRPEPTDLPINGEKIVTGDETQKDMEFTFTLTPISMVLPPEATAITDIPMPPTNTVTVVGPAAFTFGEAHYEAAGVYTYEINETIGNYVGYTFDGRIWTVTVTVTDEDGKLTAKSEYKADDDSMAELAQFTNIFETSTLTVIKTVVGVPIDTTKSFLFTVRLFDENGDPLYGTYHFTGAVTGDITTGVTSFYLRHGQSVTIYDIPIGATWTVVEHFDPEYFASRISPSGTISRQGSWSRWVNNHEEIPLGLSGVYINVGDCFE